MLQSSYSLERKELKLFQNQQLWDLGLPGKDMESPQVNGSENRNVGKVVHPYLLQMSKTDILKYLASLVQCSDRGFPNDDNSFADSEGKDSPTGHPV